MRATAAPRAAPPNFPAVGMAIKAAIVQGSSATNDVLR